MEKKTKDLIDQSIFAKEKKKTTKLSFLKEKGALKKWIIAAEILNKRKG